MKYARTLFARTKVSLFALLLMTSKVIAQTTNAGQETAVEFVAPWPPWVTIILVVLAAFFTFGLYYREQTAYRTWVKFALAAIRFGLICLVLWMMYGYTLRPFRTDLPDLLLIVDTSQSMSTIDVQRPTDEQPPTSRLQQAKNILLANDKQLADFLASNYQLKLVTLDSLETTDVESMADQISQLDATVESSELGIALRKSLQRQRGRPVAGVVMLTDGITTSGAPISEVATEAKHRGIPLHVVGLGSQLPARDLRLSNLLVDDVVFVGDLVTFDLTLSGDGYTNESIEVSLRRADGQSEPITERLTLDTERDSKSVRLAMKAEEEGKFEFIVDTPVRDGESSKENNRLRATVEVRDERTRVLLVQSYPSYEYHYLKTLFERDQRSTGDTSEKTSIELSVLLQDADPEFADIDAVALRSFPTREELFQYDVCIFGDVNPSFLGTESLANVRDFVRERGRGFIGIAGPRYFPSAFVDTPLAELVPFDIRSALAPPPDLPIEQGFRPVITALGQRMPSMQLSLNAQQNTEIWSELPELYWLLEVDSLKPGARVLAEHPTRTNTSGRALPVTTLSYVGAGKVLFQNTDDSWRWRIGRGDEYFGRFWQQSIRYLSRFKLGEGRDVELTSDRETYNRGEVVRLRTRFFDERRAPNEDDGVKVLLEQQGRGQRRIALRRDAADRGVFVADVANLGTGQYHAVISEPTLDDLAPSVDFNVESPDTELTRLEADFADLRRAAELSAGRFYPYEEAASMVDHLPVGRQVRIEPLPPEPIWNSWKIALLFLALIVTEWLGRRKAGMV